MNRGDHFMKDKDTKKLAKELLEGKNIKDVAQLQEFLKDVLKSGVETLLEAELDEELGYEKYSNEGVKDNYRNGKTKKTVRSELGEIEIEVPRDRNGEFEPKIVPKHSRDISMIEEKIISMYGKGMTTRDISDHINDMYGYELSAESISHITDKILPIIEEWQQRALEQHYYFIFMDAIFYKVRQNNRVMNKAAYIVIGINREGYKEVLGIWIGEHENSKFWLKILTDLKNRGVQRVNIFSVDGLPGFQQAILATYPKAEVQRCIIHQVRQSTRYVGYKHLFKLLKDLKLVYRAPNEEEGYKQLEAFKEKWQKLYPSCVKSWYENWDVLSPFFKYSKNIRTIMYTTNIIENLNRQYRKVTKAKPVFPTDESLLKALYLATEHATQKWTSRMRNWDQIRYELAILNGETID